MTRVTFPFSCFLLALTLRLTSSMNRRCGCVPELSCWCRSRYARCIRCRMKSNLAEVRCGNRLTHSRCSRHHHDPRCRCVNLSLSLSERHPRMLGCQKQEHAQKCWGSLAFAWWLFLSKQSSRSFLFSEIPPCSYYPLDALAHSLALEQLHVEVVVDVLFLRAHCRDSPRELELAPLPRSRTSQGTDIQPAPGYTARPAAADPMPRSMKGRTQNNVLV